MNALTLGLLGIYVAIGLAVAVGLVRAGSPPSAAAAALVAWPLLIRGRSGPTDEADPSGPLRPAIDRAFARLDDDAGRIGGLRPEWLAERSALRDALYRADARLAVVDRILVEDRDDPPSATLADGLQRLRARRQRSVAEIELVLGEIAQMRVQMGLLALSGDAVPLRDGLRSLVARARALDELESLVEPPP